MDWYEYWRKTMRPYLGLGGAFEQSMREYERIRDLTRADGFMMNSIRELQEARYVEAQNQAFLAAGEQLCRSIGLDDYHQRLMDQVAVANSYEDAIWAHVPRGTRDILNAQSYVDMNALTQAASSASALLKDAGAFIDFHTIQNLADDFSSRIQDYLDDHPLESIDDWGEALEESGADHDVADQFRQAIEDAIERLMPELIDRLGSVKKANARWARGVTRYAVLLVIQAVVGYVVWQILDAVIKRSDVDVDESREMEALAQDDAIEDYVFAKNSVVLRQGPAGSNPQITVVPAGTLLIVRKRKVGWLQVRYEFPGGDGAVVTGWVRAKSVRSVAQETHRMLVKKLVSWSMKEE